MNAPNEGREEKTEGELLEEALIHIDELNEQVELLRDQLSKEREKNENPENLLVEMSVTLNNLVRAYDQKDEGLMKFTMQKAHDLSHKGIGRLTELDKLNEQLEKERETFTDKLKLADKNNELLRGHRDELQTQLEKEREMRKELVQWMEGFKKLEPIITYPDNVPPEHEGEMIALSNALYKMKHLIAKASELDKK